jgi:DNA polymerase-3 subunit alpha
MIVQEIEFIRRDNVYDFSILTSSDGLRHSFVDGVIVHNCGVCISIDPITDIVPLFASKDGAVTQYDGETLEKIGLIKYDILGLKNLSVISRTFELIKKVRGIDLGVIDILPDDPDAYEVITSGNSYGVFQIEGSQGLRDFAAAARPTNLTELAAVISLNLEW